MRNDSPLLKSFKENKKKRLSDTDIVELLSTKSGWMERNTALFLNDCSVFAAVKPFHGLFHYFNWMLISSLSTTVSF